RFLQQSHIDNLSRNQDIAVGLQVILKPRARPTPTWTSMPERTLDFEFWCDVQGRCSGPRP
ncbi:hypothetical protein ACEPWY_33690, partial [Pseudomonas aeruginosa]